MPTSDTRVDRLNRPQGCSGPPPDPSGPPTRPGPAAHLASGPAVAACSGSRPFLSGMLCLAPFLSRLTQPSSHPWGRERQPRHGAAPRRAARTLPRLLPCSARGLQVAPREAHSQTLPSAPTHISRAATGVPPSCAVPRACDGGDRSALASGSRGSAPNLLPESDLDAVASPQHSPPVWLLSPSLPRGPTNRPWSSRPSALPTDPEDNTLLIPGRPCRHPDPRLSPATSCGVIASTPKGPPWLRVTHLQIPTRPREPRLSPRLTLLPPRPAPTVVFPHAPLAPEQIEPRSGPLSVLRTWRSCPNPLMAQGPWPPRPAHGSPCPTTTGCLQMKLLLWRIMDSFLPASPLSRIITVRDSRGRRGG